MALYLLGIVAAVVFLVSAVAVLVTGTYPAGMFRFLAGFERWRLRVSAYLALQTDRYPPFSFDDGAFVWRDYAVRNGARLIELLGSG